MRRLALALAVLGAGGVARAGGPDDVIAPRGVGRAGTGTVSDDGAGAVFASPAALARRAELRAQLGVTVIDDGLTYTPDRIDATDARAQGAPWIAPVGAVIAGLGPIVVGVGVAVDRTGRSFATPDDELLPDSINRFFAYRYAGLTTDVERRTAAVAAAARVTDWLALGAAATVASVRIHESRRLWAGFPDGGDQPGDPQFDVDARLVADDNVVPGAVFGVLVAPASLPLEVAASVAWSNQIHVRGNATLAAVSSAVGATGGAAGLDLPTATVVRGGARWLGDRWTVEVGVDAWLPRDDDPVVWQLDGASVVDAASQRAAPVLAIPSRLAPRRRFAGRAAIDVEVVAGFLWITGGYAWRSRATPPDRLAPTTADLGGHTAALGVEIASGGFTVTVGWSRSFTRARTITSSALGLDDPFDPATGPTGIGRYDAARDTLGLTLEFAKE